jgi:proteasome lid subunit RPN8/RPN11
MRVANDREAEEQYHRFLITPEDSFRADRAARKKGMDVIGCYHSHPNAPARPSQYDVDHAAWAEFSHIIVSILNGKAADMTSWLLKEDRSAFNPEEIRIGA